MGLLDRYVLRRFLGFYGVALLYLVGLYLVVDLVSRLEHFFDAEKSLAAAGRTVLDAVLAYYAAALPLMAIQVAPFVTVLAASMTVVDLRRWNELTPMIGAGRSLARVLAPVLAFALLLTAGLIWLQDRVAPRVVAARLEVERSLRDEKDRATFRVPHVRDGAGNTWSVASYDHISRSLTRVRVAPFTASGVRWDLLAADRATYREGPGGRGWYPEGGLLLVPAEGAESGAATVAVPGDRPLPTDLRPEDVDLARDSEDLEGLSRRRIEALRARNPELHQLTVLLHRRSTLPLANLILVLVGVPLVLRGRGGSLFLSVLSALGVCAAYFIADTFACDLGSRGVLPPVLASWITTIVFAAAGATMLDGTRAEGS